MNMLRRFLLCLISLVLLAVAGGLGICAFRPDSVKFSLERTLRVLSGGQHFWWLLLAAVVLLLLGALCLFVSLARKSAPTQVIIGKSEGGQVNISMEAVDNVVKRAALSVSGVKDVKSKLKAANNGVSVNLQVALPHDTNVPETATAIQTAVKEQLQTITGLAVAEVAIVVTSVEGRPTKVADTNYLGG